MAAISSVTGSGLTAPVYNWNNTAAWQGGVVPGAADDVTIAGFRTTINQSAISKWTSGTITVTVASTTGFPSTGYFYVGTNRGEVLKVNYTGLTGTTFTGCTLDLTDPFYYWDLGGQIANGTTVHSPAPIINIPNGVTGSCLTLIIQNGGWVNIAAGGILNCTGTITHRDGRLIGRGSPGAIGKLQIFRPEANGVGFYTTENFTLQILDLDGGETRTYAPTTGAISVGGTSVTLGTLVNGSFAVGDEVAIYDTGFQAKGRRPRLYTSYSGSGTADYRGMDEGFDVAGVSGSTLYLARRNGAKGTVKQVVTSGSQKIVTVDKNDHLSQMQFKAGDKVVINNAEYTIDSVRDSEFQLASYNFQTGSTLNDFLIDDISIEDSWAIDAYGAYTTNANYNALVNKNIYRRELIMDVEMSPLSQYTAGTRGTADQFGLVFGYDPTYRKGHRTQNDLQKTGSFKISDFDDTILFNEKSTSASNIMNMSRDAAGLRTLLQVARTYRLELRNMIYKTYVDGEQIHERFAVNGGQRGLFGVYSWNNQSVRVKSITYKAPTQDLYITTANSFSSGDIVYESGAEIAHAIGRRVLKISSRITNIEGHDDFAFAYRGAYDPGVWPVVNGINADVGTNSTSNYIINHDMSIDYYQDLGTTANRFATFDLTKQKTFTHVSFVPRTEDMGSLPGMVGVTIQGSNDGTNWTTIYATATDTKRYQNGQWYNQMGMYAVGTQTYRYVKFLTNGHNGTANTTLNRWVNVGVHDFTNGFKITLNNASDFVVGDIIGIQIHNGWYSCDDSQTYTAVKASQNPDTYLHTPNTHATITAITGNTLTLDKPVNWGYLEGRETVVKINRNFKVEGFISKGGGTLWQKPYFRHNNGTSTPRVLWHVNTYFEHVGSSRLGGSNWFRGVDLATSDYNNPAIVDGCTFECYNGSGANGLTSASGFMLVRNSYIANLYDYRPAYGADQMGSATFNCKLNNIFRPFLEVIRDGMFNYNEIASHYQYIIQGAIQEFGIVPHAAEFRRNSFHGNRDVSGFYDFQAANGSAMSPVIINEYNRVYATNTISMQYRETGNLSVPRGWDIHAEHPGQRLTGSRSEGFTGWWANIDATDPYSGVNDFMRADYDFQLLGLYHHSVKYKNADYIRMHSPSNSQINPICALRAYRSAAVATQVYIEFEYRHAMRYNRIQNSNFDFGMFRIICVSNGVAVTNSPQYTINAATLTDGWTKYSYTFNAIPTEAGALHAFITRAASTTFCDIRNMRAYLMTNNPESVSVYNNTFDQARFFDFTNHKKDTRPIAAAGPVKVRRLKV